MHRTFVTLLDDDYTFRLPLGTAKASLVAWRQQYDNNNLLQTQGHTCDHPATGSGSHTFSPEARAEVHRHPQ